MNEQLTQVYGYLHGMWRYRWSALGIAWAVALAGWLYVIALPNQYSARAVVYIDTTSVMRPLLAGLALETSSDDEIQIMSRVLLSRDNLLTVMRETDMDLEADSPVARERLVQSLASTIKIKGGSKGPKKAWEPKNDIYEISYNSTSADRTYQVVSKLLNTMIEGTLNSTRTDTVIAQKFLDSQIEIHEQRLTQAEQQLAEFKKANVGYMPDEKGGYYQRLQSAQDAVDGTRSALSLAERRYSELSKQLRGENPLLDRASYELASATKLRAYQEQLALLLNQYTENHPDVQAIRSAMTDLEANQNTASSIASAAAGNTGSSGGSDDVEFNPVYQSMKVDLSKAGVDVETLKIQLVEQENRVKKLKSSIDIIPEVEARLSKLNRDYELTRDRYLKLVERRESARLAQNAGQNTSDVAFRVIEPPIVPVQPSGPKRLMLLTGVLAAALGAGLGWSLLRYFLQPTFVNLHQLRIGTGLPVLGTVSLYLSPEHRQKRQRQLITFFSATFMLTCVYGGIMAVLL